MRHQTVRIFGSIEDLSHCAAVLFLAEAEHAMARHGRFSVALSGGSTPGPVYSLLSGEGYRSRIDWEKVHFFWTDERCVPPDHPDSNYRLAYDLLLSKLPLPDTNIHRIRGELPAERAADEYEKDLLSHFSASDVPRFDLVFLGVGVDGHTASIFPGAEEAGISAGLALSARDPRSGSHRITLSHGVINNAGTVVFLVTGKTKAAIISEILEGSGRSLPAAQVNPKMGRMLWFLDRDAAFLLKNVR